MAHDFGNLVDPDDALTPNRTSRIRFDVAETVVLADGYTAARFRGEIAAGAGVKAFTPQELVNDGARFAFLWPCGVWTCAPLPFLAEELEAVPSADSPSSGMTVGVIGAPQVGPEAGTSPLPTTDPAAGDGIYSGPSTTLTPVPDIASSVPANAPPLSDWRSRKNIDLSGVLSPGTYPLALSGVLAPPVVSIPSAPILAPPAPLPAVNVADRDTVVRTTLNLPADTGVLIRFAFGGIPGFTPPVICGARFGQYYLEFGGSGIAHLWEYCRATPEGSPRYIHRYAFPYCHGDPVQENHQIMVYPVLGPKGEKYLNFIGKALTRSTSIPASINASDASAPTERVYTASWLTRGLDVDESPGHVTYAGPAWLDVNRQLFNLEWQFGRLIFAKGALLPDAPHSSEPLPTSRMWGMYVVPAMETQFSTNGPVTGAPWVSAALKNVNTGATDYGGLLPNGRFETEAATAWLVQPNFVLTGYDSPSNHSAYCRRPAGLWGYILGRAPIFNTIEPGEFEMDHAGFNLTGDNGDPRSAGGSGSLWRTSASPARAERLVKRGTLSAVVETDLLTPGTGAPITVRLFRGDAVRNDYDLKPGFPNGSLRGNAMDDFLAYPGIDWGSHDIKLVPLFARLSEHTTRTVWSLRRYAYDPNAPLTVLPGGGAPIPTPWKATDVIKDLLGLAGFPPEMIAIPDLPIRLFYGLGVDASIMTVDPNTNLAERCVALARNFLGRFLVFDAAAGDYGQWTLIAIPPPGTAALANIVEGPASATYVPAPHLPSHYPANTLLVVDQRTGYTNKPGQNHLWIFTAPDATKTGGVRMERHFYNWDSYQVPGCAVVPDPESEQYIGREIKAVCPMPELFQGDSDPSLTYSALMQVGFRIFQNACRAQAVKRVTVPFWPIQDPVLGHWRPLRYGDPVTYNGDPDWFVKSPGISLPGDRNQRQQLEIAKLIPITGLAA